MSDTAKHLIENVFPKEAIRQWVLTMPYQLRLLMASNKKILTKVLKIYHKIISRFYLKRAKKLFKKEETPGESWKKFPELVKSMDSWKQFKSQKEEDQRQFEMIFWHMVKNEKDVLRYLKKVN